MSMVVRQHTENNYYVTLEVKNVWGNDIYIVEVCPCYDNNMCGYPLQKMTYSIKDKKNAEATFRRYVKKYCKGE